MYRLLRSLLIILILSLVLLPVAPSLISLISETQPLPATAGEQVEARSRSQKNLLPPSLHLNQSQDDSRCLTALANFTSRDGWVEELIDPVLTSQEQVNEKRELYQDLFVCLESMDQDLTGNNETISRLLEYFLIFAGSSLYPEDGSQIDLVDLARSEDEAVVQIRDEAGLAPPPGYVFIRQYDSRERMPPPIAEIFLDPVVAGVTIYSRYIAVLAENPASYQRKILMRSTLPRTISHELIHAYVHASLPPDGYTKLPEWFNEGVAIFFSKSGENHILLTPNMLLVQTTTQDYLQYKDNFDYLEAQLGRERLLELIRTSIEQGEPALVYQELGIENEQYLRTYAQGWREKKVRQGQILSIASAAVLALLVVWLAPSEVRCTCGYAGRKGDFEHGLCPRCGQPAAFSRRVSSPLGLYAECEVCERKFWLWYRKQVDILPYGTHLWTKQQGSYFQGDARQVSATRVCEECRRESVELELAVQAEMRPEFEQVRQEAYTLFQAWLEAAPRAPALLREDLQVLPFNQALEQFVLAGLYPFHPSWLQPPGFRFRKLGTDTELPAGFGLRIPTGYDEVLERSIDVGEMNGILLGTVHLLPEGQVGIHWVPDADNTPH